MKPDAVAAGRAAPVAPPGEVAVSGAELERYVGNFWSDEIDATYRIVIKDGSSPRCSHARRFRSRPIGGDRFRAAEWGRWSFKVGGMG